MQRELQSNNCKPHCAASCAWLSLQRSWLQIEKNQQDEAKALGVMRTTRGRETTINKTKHKPLALCGQQEGERQQATRQAKALGVMQRTRGRIKKAHNTTCNQQTFDVVQKTFESNINLERCCSKPRGTFGRKISTK